MKKVAAVSLAITAFCSAQAQTPEADPENNYKNSISFDVSRLFNNNTNTYGLLYKRDFSKTALRVGLNGSYSSRKREPGGSQDYRSYAVLPQIGLEWHKPVGNRWMWYYGADLQGVFLKSESRNYHNPELFSESETTIKGAGLTGFAGVRYHIHERFSASLEPQFISISHDNMETTTINRNLGPDAVRDFRDESRTDINLFSRLNLFLTYRF